MPDAQQETGPAEVSPGTDDFQPGGQRKLCEEIGDEAEVRHYILQSTMAFLFMATLLIVLKHAGDLIIVASLASTTFLVLARPRTYGAKPRCVLGGHVMALAVGSTCVAIMDLLPDLPIVSATMGALAVSIALFVMTITNTEHAPAAGTALAMVVNREHSLKVMAAVLMGSVFLSFIWWAAKGKIRDLT